MRKATKKDWIKCVIAVVLYLLFLLWVKSWWGLIVLPFIVDNYITKLIPWGWWKKSENKLLRSVMSWVDALVFLCLFRQSEKSFLRIKQKALH